MTRKEILNAAKSAGITTVNGVAYTNCSNETLLKELNDFAHCKGNYPPDYQYNKFKNMTRTEIYAKLEELNLINTVKEKYGRNFTNCSNDLLLTVISEAMAAKVDATKNGKKEIFLKEEDTFKAAVVLMLSFIKAKGQLDDVLKAVNETKVISK